MYALLSAINAVLFVYVAWAWVSPKTALFFIKCKDKRRRNLMCLWLTLGYLVVFFVLATLGENTDGFMKEQSENMERERIETEKSAKDSAEHKRDSLLRDEIDRCASNAVTNQAGPTDASWRRQQWLFAKRDSINLSYVNYQLNNKFSVDKVSKEFYEFDRMLTNAANPKWPQKDKYRIYYEDATAFTDSAQHEDCVVLMRLIDRNNKEAIRITQKFNGKIK